MSKEYSWKMNGFLRMIGKPGLPQLVISQHEQRPFIIDLVWLSVQSTWMLYSYVFCFKVPFNLNAKNQQKSNLVGVGELIIIVRSHALAVNLNWNKKWGSYSSPERCAECTVSQCAGDISRPSWIPDSQTFPVASVASREAGAPGGMEMKRAPLSTDDRSRSRSLHTRTGLSEPGAPSYRQSPIYIFIGFWHSTDLRVACPRITC